ncbi:MAG: cbb3-type cytochrome c oxidase subunit I [Micrococcales bacterium]|nr:cbb3-type cytochrome c oxidase subunit I [Micrococcales bacterium]MCL2667590.1 cbb3-type cytochrome c oxidase subunit I [Micrococcales bacterium]
MSTFTDTLLNGNKGTFKVSTLTPLQKLTLKFVVFGLVYYAFAVIEGMLMRVNQVKPMSFLGTEEDGFERYFAMLSAHPLVGIFGASYLMVFGAFLFLVPFLMKKPLWSYKMANWTLWLIVGGVFTFWLDGFLTHYAPLYTLYWPLPADFDQFNPVSGALFIVGIAVVMVGTLLYVINLFKTITFTPEGWTRQRPGALLGDALGLTSWKLLFQGKLSWRKPQEHLVSLPVAAIARGSVDVLFNVLIITFSGVLILVFMVAKIFGNDLSNTSVDALLYKNWYWWGLDLVADGLVLVFVAGAWYLLVQLITGREVFMARWARFALGLELVVSWTVWSHHLLSDQAQPAALKMGSGEFVTALELVTQGLAFFIAMVTLWQARPLKMTFPLKFLIGGLLGFALAVPAGIMQADAGLNRVLHNTQWIVGPHVHVAVLVGLTMTLYAAVYFLLPILTNGAELWSTKLANVHFWCHLVGGIGMGAFMGMAGLQGMLRRTMYTGGEFRWEMVLAAASGVLLFVALACFLVNIVMTLGLKGALGLFKRSEAPASEIVPGSDLAVQPAEA